MPCSVRPCFASSNATQVGARPHANRAWKREEYVYGARDECAQEVWRGRGARHLVRLAKKNFGNDRWGEQRTLGFALVFCEIFSFYERRVEGDGEDLLYRELLKYTKSCVWYLQRNAPSGLIRHR